jgi:hypothetical protein
MKLWKIIPHSWMTKPCDGGEACSEGSDAGFHTADTTFWFRIAYGR